MAGLLYNVNLIVASRPFIETEPGIKAWGRFRERSDEILKDAMNDARKRLRNAAPVRTRKLQRSFRISKIRRKRHPLGELVVGYQITTGRSNKVFYASITDRRPDTRVANWFQDALEEIQGSSQFLNWRDEVRQLFSDAIRIEYRETLKRSLRARFIAGFPGAFVVSERPNLTIIRADLSPGQGRIAR